MVITSPFVPEVLFFSSLSIFPSFFLPPPLFSSCTNQKVTMASFRITRLVLIISLSAIVFNAVQGICVPRSSEHLSQSPSPSSVPQGQSDSSPASQPDSSFSLDDDEPASDDAPASPPAYDARNSYPPIYYPPNAQPVDSPGSQPDSSSSPTSAPTPNRTPTPSPASVDMDTSSTSFPTAPKGEASVSAEPKSFSTSAFSMDGGTDSLIGPSKFAAAPLKLKEICESTDHPELCISIVAPFSIAKIDPITVLQAAIKACTDHAKLAISTTAKLSLLQVGSTGLDTCKESYSDAVDNLQKALDAVATKDIGTMNSMLSAAITDFGDCRDAVGVLATPLAAYNEKLKNIASVCLAIVSSVPQ